MKTVTLDDEAYGLLLGAKTAPRESFSHVVKRMFRACPSLEDSFGGWSDMTDAEAARLRSEVRDAFDEHEIRL